MPKVAGRADPEVVVMEALYDERRSARFRHVVSSLNHSSTSEQSAPDQVSAALDRMLIADAMTQLSAEHRALIERSYSRGCTGAQIAADLQIAEGMVISRLHHAVRALRLTLQKTGAT